MSKLQITGAIILLLILLGFGAAEYIEPNTSTTCTKMACLCQSTSYSNSSEALEVENFTGERDCNTCSSKDTLFHLGVFKIYRDCTETQIYQCTQGEKVDEYYREESCEYKLGTFLPIMS